MGGGSRGEKSRIRDLSQTGQSGAAGKRKKKGLSDPSDDEKPR